MTNEAKYEAILAGLEAVKILGLKESDIVSDPKVVLGHITGESTTHELNMKKYLEAVQL